MDAAAAIARAEAAVADLAGLSLYSNTDDEILDLWRRLETLNRQLASVDHSVISQVQQRHLAFANGAKSDAVLARDMLRISAAEAQQRIKAADACGPRVSMTGEPSPPVFPHVAAAQAAGAISLRHARVIVSTVEHLPDAVQADVGEQVERELTGYAHDFDPDSLAKIARHLTSLLDPDGLLHEAEQRDRQRELNLRRRADGSGQLVGEATAELAELLETVFDSMARPRPTGPDLSERDPRTAGQRRHDALLEALRLTVRAELVPAAGGVTTTVILTGNVTDWATATGTMTTGHGATVATVDAQRWVGGDARFLGVLFDGMKRVEAHSGTHRLFTERQRLAMAARDGGCTFPNCDAPPGQCEAHHMINYSDGGPTSIDNGALLCSANHRDHERMGWRGVMIDGVPAWIPPRWIDSARTPRRNALHRPASDLQPV